MAGRTNQACGWRFQAGARPGPSECRSQRRDEVAGWRPAAVTCPANWIVPPDDQPGVGQLTAVVGFLGIGAQKAATTWLYHQLSRHPQVRFPGGKELHFWDRFDAQQVNLWQNMLTPETPLTPAGQPVLAGEICPAYAILSPEVIAAVAAACPDVPLFVSLRNPMERAWSAAVMALVRAQMRECEASDQWFIDHFNSAASRARGDYVGMLDRWWGSFAREQLLIVFRDDIAAAPAAVLDRLARHMGIDPGAFPQANDQLLGQLIVPRLTGDPNFDNQEGIPVRPTLVPVLAELYNAQIQALADKLDRDLSPWLQWPAHTPPGAPPARTRVAAIGSGAAQLAQLALPRPGSRKTTSPGGWA